MEENHGKNLNFFNPEITERLVKIVVEYGQDSEGERGWTIWTEGDEKRGCGIIAGSSGGFRGGTLEEKERDCVEWFRGMLREEGYRLFEIERREKSDGDAKMSQMPTGETPHQDLQLSEPDSARFLSRKRDDDEGCR